MKKFLSICLILTMLLVLTACDTNTPPATEPAAQVEGHTLQPGQLLAGYAKVDITPEDPVPLAGFGNSNQRISSGFIEYIYATCIVLTDAQNNSSILVGMDFVSTSAVVFSELRTSLSEIYGIPESSIVFSASHMHSGPDLSSDHLNIQRYTTFLTKQLLKAVETAMADRAPADLYITSAETQGLNFVRRYVLEGNIYAGYQSDITESGLPIIGHETDADGELQLIKFDRPEDKTDIVLANFQTHPHRGDGSTKTLINANLVGAFRDAMKERTGYDVVYFTGASGNINPDSQIDSENITSNYTEQGQMLAKYAVDAEPTYVKVNGGIIRSTTATFEGPVNHADEHLLEVASEAGVVWRQTNSVAEVRKAFLDKGIHSPYHASAIITRSKLGDYLPFDVWAISIGDISFAIAPYEMFDTNGKYIKDNTPFDMTFVVTVANGGNGYFPSEIAWDHGGYEPDTTKYARGSAEKLASLYVEMLDELSSAK